ncbi:MAG: MFS transporter [Elusimicrobia bacterium]|nr:MFS transporter [Elusimicrobiota bacterium]
MSKFLESLGLHRKELRAWALYDWANSAFSTTIIAAVFPIYFYRVAASGLSPSVASGWFATATTFAMVLMAFFSPLLGALADFSGIKKKMLGFFLGIGVSATGCMFFIQKGDWKLASWLFILGNIGASGSTVFYDSLLPHITSPKEMDRVSSAGYALGYLGGGLLLALNLAWIQKPQLFGISDSLMATRLAFLSVAAWWLLFSIPLFRQVPEPPRTLESDETSEENPVYVTFIRLKETLKDLRRYRQAFLMLLAFLVYNDGINTIIRMATLYGTEIGINQGALITAILLVQFVGIPFSFLFGFLANKIGTKRALFLSLTVYIGISLLAHLMKNALHFFLLAILVGTVQGGSQALSRSLFASMIPRHKSSEFFGFFSVFEKFAGILGPAIFASTVWFTGSSRNAILSIILFFIVGGILLAFVNVEEGQRVARESELKR